MTVMTGLIPDNTLNCDLNLLTGKGVRNGKTVTAPTAVTLADWNDQTVSAVCFQNKNKEIP
ncbi:MAG: hypothetical protein R3E89_18510 [Thiolinea sp.]